MPPFRLVRSSPSVWPRDAKRDTRIRVANNAVIKLHRPTLICTSFQVSNERFRPPDPIENLNGTIRRVSRSAKRWQGGTMVKRWVAAGVLEAQRGFPKLRGYKSMPDLVRALGTIDNLDQEQHQAA